MLVAIRHRQVRNLRPRLEHFFHPSQIARADCLGSCETDVTHAPDVVVSKPAFFRHSEEIPIRRFCPASFISCFNACPMKKYRNGARCYGQAISARETRHTANGLPKLRDACSNTFFTSSRDTPGDHSRNSSIVAPPSRFENRAGTGTRVPRNTQAPLTLSACRSTAGQDIQSSIGKLSPIIFQQPNRAAPN